MRNSQHNPGMTLVFGVAGGIVIGAILNNIALGIVVGLAIAIAINARVADSRR